MSEQENFDPITADPNGFIIEKFNEIKLLSDVLKEARLEKKEKLNESDYILELMNQYDEKKEEIKPITQKLKVAKDEFKAKHIDLFMKEDNIKKQIKWLNDKIVKAYTHKKVINDESPIMIGEGKKQRQLVINLEPKVTKQKI